VLLIICFLGLVMTGVPLKYSDKWWAGKLANALGGFETTSVWHHFFAVMILAGCVCYLIHYGKRLVGAWNQRVGWRARLFGLDSPVPNARDFKDLLGMVRWFFGMGRKPTFERWTYWEKFDYWALVVSVLLIGLSGLVLWFPNLFSRFLPGQTLNVAKMVHSEITLVLGGFFFVIHVFNTHLRPEKFPLDMSLFTGLVSEEHLRSARPEYLDRLRREGKLEEVLTVVPEKRWLRRIAWAGWSILAVGMVLLAVILLVSLGE
jgi:cytochrome b subunit of formate dehydrogenase